MSGFWDRSAALYDFAETTNSRANRAMAQAVARWVSPGSRVLDCAAGTGELSLAAAKKARCVLCTDLSPAMLAQARRKAQGNGVTNIAFAQRDIFSPYAPRLFDAVIAGNVLHLLDRPEQAVAALSACLRPGGRLILPTYLQGETAPQFRPLLAAFRLAGFRFRHAYTRDGYRAMLLSCGAGRLQCFQVLPGMVPVGFAVITKQEAVL